MTNHELSSHYSLDDSTVRQFSEDGFVRLENVLSPETLTDYTPDISRLVDEKNPNKGKALEERSLYDQAFIQVGNLWTECEHVRELTFSTRLANIAAQLMGTRGVRLWHDQALYKGAIESVSVAI